MTTPYTLIMGRGLSDELRVMAGETIALLGAREKAGFTVLGVLGGEGLSLVDGGRIAVTDIATFQEFTGEYDEIDQIDIRIRPGAPPDADQYHQGVAAGRHPAVPAEPGQGDRAWHDPRLPAQPLGAELRVPVRGDVPRLQPRRPECGVPAPGARHPAFRGASRQMVFVLFLLEGAFFGILGWALAFPVSAVMVGLMVEGISRTISILFVRVTIDQLNLDAWEVVLSFGVTLAVSVLAAAEPAYEAMQVSPREALSSTRSRTSVRRIAHRLAVVGAVFVASVWPLSRMPAVSGIPLPGYVATFVLFAGFALMSPFFLGLISIRLSPLLRRMAGEPAYLAGRYLRDSGIRVAVSVGSLITAVALFSALVIMVHSFRGTVNLWVNQTVSGDLFVTPKLGEINQHRNPFSPEIARALESIDVPADRVHFRRFYLTYDRVPYQFEAIDFAPFFRHGSYIWIDGDPEAAQGELLEGRGIIVSEVFANHTGLGVGDLFRDRIAGNPVDVPIVGVIRDYRSQGGVAFFSLAHYEAIRGRGGGDPGRPEWSGVRFFFRDTDRVLNGGSTG